MSDKGTALPRSVLFVTGRLAEPALRRVVSQLDASVNASVAPLKITVAALMTTEWIARFLSVPPGTDLIVIPGLCEGDVGAVSNACGVQAVKGPKDLREIPQFFTQKVREPEYGEWDIEILAEINNAGRLTAAELHAEAERLFAAGADLIDVGCTPGRPFPELAAVVRRLRSSGMRVSVDSFDADEIQAAVDAGAELVLSVNQSNLAVASRLVGTGASVVVIPDLGAGIDTMVPTVEHLDALGVPYVLDPILEPVGHGFAASLQRYAQTRERFPDAEMLMGVGNLTELTAADTTGVNAILIAVCQELGIRRVLTTEVMPWARGAVREIDIARRLMHYAITHRTIPKGVDDRLVTVKDPRPLAYSEAELRGLKDQITDPNFRIFADADAITVLNRDLFLRGRSINELFDQLPVADPRHAFYLGKELARAHLAMVLGKTYRQEGMLSWGYLTPQDDTASDRVTLTQPPRRPD